MTATPLVTAEPTFGERWRHRSPLVRALVVVAGALLGVNALLAGLSTVTGGDPSGPSSSSYATSPRGLAAYADLLGRSGHPVERYRSRLDKVALDPATTVVVADSPGISREEAAALARFVATGGRLIVTGPSAAEILGPLLETALDWSSDNVGVATPLAPVPEVAGVAAVRSAGPGAWADARSTLPVLGDRDGKVLATVASVAQGRVVALADTSPLQNRRLGEADNAAFGLAAAGEPGRPVRFAELAHGYGARSGFGAIPTRWKWALAGVAVATLVGMWARGRRLGPAEDIERPLPPPRRAYVDAMAASLAKARRPEEAMAPLQRHARARLASRAGLAADGNTDANTNTDIEAFRHAAARLGLPPDEVTALITPARTDADVKAIGSAVARLERRS